MAECAQLCAETVKNIPPNNYMLAVTGLFFSFDQGF